MSDHLLTFSVKPDRQPLGDGRNNPTKRRALLVTQEAQLAELVGILVEGLLTCAGTSPHGMAFTALAEARARHRPDRVFRRYGDHLIVRAESGSECQEKLLWAELWLVSPGPAFVVVHDLL